jgi:hypothetical protein
MKKNKKQRKSKILLKFHKGALKLSISEKSTNSNYVYTSVGKRKGINLISYVYGYSGIKFAMVRKFNYKAYLHIPTLNIKQQKINKLLKED